MAFRPQPQPDHLASRSQNGPSRSIPVIGLTGGIGSGKSTVGRILERLGCVVSVADDEVRKLLEDDEHVRSTLVNWWGDDIVGPDARIDRSRLAEIVFTKESELRRLEGLLHPRVARQRTTEWARMVQERGSSAIRAFVIDAPLLFEAGLQRECDAVIFIEAPRSVRIERVRQTRGWDESELDRREKTQWPLDRKRQASDYVIRNDTSLDRLEENVEAVLDRILHDSLGNGVA